jgi:signal transduction histidine kinase
LGRTVGEALVTGTATDAALALAHVLAADPKWEVRLTIADTLLNLPDDDFGQLTGRMGDDSNTYVRGAVERARERRREQQRANGRTRRSADQVSQHLQAIESEYGKAAAGKALRLCERYSELLIGSMVHDLRSILTHLKTNCFALIDESADSKTTGRPRRAVTRVRSDLEFLETAIGDMAAFTQPSPAEHRPERLAEIIAAAHDLARDNVRKVKLDPDAVTVSIDVPEPLVIDVGRHQIVMAVANVLKNAYEAFAATGGQLRTGHIHVEAALFGDFAKITIRDDGMGMSEEESQGPLLFTPGRRNKTKRHSTGYGLPIAARNIVAQGGSMSLDSRENEGTTVTLLLPLAQRKGTLL